jgi:putative transposase
MDEKFSSRRTRQLYEFIRAALDASNGIYGSPRGLLDLREAGEPCSKHRVARLTRANHIRPVWGYSRKPKAGVKPSGLVPNVRSDSSMLDDPIGPLYLHGEDSPSTNV